MIRKRAITLHVNNRNYEVYIKPNRMLLDVLREDLGLTGSKRGCSNGDCGACTVLMDGYPVFSCLILALEASGHEIITIESIADGNVLHPLQQAFIDNGAIQCGYCTPGMILTGISLLRNNPNPTEDDVRKAISGNLCRCTGYQKIVDAILAAAQTMRANPVTEYR
jgi:aerobic-type carbon monoxide dehydrogenase small subunit (CoxS/CutS family)